MDGRNLRRVQSLPKFQQAFPVPIVAGCCQAFPDHAGDPFGHFRGGFFREGNRQHLADIDFFFENNVQLVDFIGRFESLNDDFKGICSRLNIQTMLPHVNARADEIPYLDYYSQNSIDMIFEAYKEDIEAFNYRKPVLPD